MSENNLSCEFYNSHSNRTNYDKITEDSPGARLEITFRGGDTYSTHIGNHKINRLLKSLLNPNKNYYGITNKFKSNYITRLVLLKYIKDNKSRFTKSLGDFMHDNDI